MLFKPTDLEKTIASIKAGNIALFPFDTLMGLTALISKDNCQRIHSIKQRNDQPFIIILPHLNHLYDWVEPISPATETLLKRYWPGPITFVFNKKSTVPDYLTAGKPTIAIRICDFLPVNLLMKALQQPILSTSANPHGQPVAQSIDDCDPSIIDAVDHSFNGCTAYYNQPSTIIDLTVTPPQQLRKGVVPFES